MDLGNAHNDDFGHMNILPGRLVHESELDALRNENASLRSELETLRAAHDLMKSIMDATQAGRPAMRVVA